VRDWEGQLVEIAYVPISASYTVMGFPIRLCREGKDRPALSWFTNEAKENIFIFYFGFIDGHDKEWG
jgi:hypothetical protein